jgi:hypothetical protein
VALDTWVAAHRLGSASMDVGAGTSSTVVMVAEGRLWVWGYDGCVTAGVLPQQQEAWRPRLVQGQLQGHRVSTFDVGESCALHTCGCVLGRRACACAVYVVEGRGCPAS